MKNSKNASVTYFFGLALLIISCTDSNTFNAEDQAESLRALRQNSGLALPVETRLLHHQDGNYGLNYKGNFEWIVTVRSEFSISFTSETNHKIAPFTLEWAVKSIKERLGEKAAIDPLKASICTWNNGDFSYKSRILYCDSGTYLLIAQHYSGPGR